MPGTGQPVLAYLGLGSNLGDRRQTLHDAQERLDKGPGLRILRRSSIVESAPLGVLDQPWFLNCVLEVETDLEPDHLLQRIKSIELELGRRPSPRWSARAIDIDILLYDDQRIDDPELVVPHPEMWHRRFVLEPLAELLPDLRGPDGKSVRERTAELSAEQVIRQPLPATGG